MGMKPINFSKVIEASGLSKKEIAYRKGIKPETLSRHISGAIRMTLDDAWEYSEILNCLPQEVFFPSQPMPILGSVQIKNNSTNRAIDTIFNRNLIEKIQGLFGVLLTNEKILGLFFMKTTRDMTGVIIG